MTAAAGLSRERLERANPEWAGWLALVDEARRTLVDPAWAPALRAGGAAPPAPFLADAVLEVDEAMARQALRRLAAIAAKSPGPAASLAIAAQDRDVDALGVLEAAVRDDRGALETWATRLDAAAEALGAIAALAATPLLHACWRAWGGQRPEPWVEGYCPLCGAWPILAEVRGLEQSRRLRCGRCSADWHGAWLRCVFCGNGDHARLGSLVLDAGAAKVETCETCRGYLKSMTTLMPTPAGDLALADLATVELDVAAVEQGYTRPAAAWPLHTRLIAR
jgi:FdhE protein